MTWQEVPFGHLYAIPSRNGLNRPQSVRGTGYKMVNMTELFAFDRLRNPPMDYVPMSEGERRGFLLKEGDLLFARRSLVIEGAGKCSIVMECPQPTTYESSIIRVRLDTNIADPHFYYYYFSSSLGKASMQSIVMQVAAAGIRSSDLKDLLVPHPPLQVQNKIGSSLSAYDDLIESNRRRIQILEEMVRATYREWFVYFRFPGHEKVKMVESEMGEIPEGWSLLTVGEVLSTLESGSRPKGGIDPHERGVPSIGAENILGLGQYDYSKEKYVSCVFYDKMSRGRIRSGDVLLYKDGASLGRKSMFRDGFPHEQCCINEHVFILRSNDYVSQNYLYFWLDRPDMTQRIVNLNANAAQPGINQSSIRGLPILVPHPSLTSKFEDMVDPMIALLFNLAKQIKSLSEARDLLLPKLVSGEIDVSHLDIEVTLPNTQQTSKYKEQSTLDQWTDGDDQDADIG